VDFNQGAIIITVEMLTVMFKMPIDSLFSIHHLLIDHRNTHSNKMDPQLQLNNIKRIWSKRIIGL